jgi:hypothetical protein
VIAITSYGGRLRHDGLSARGLGHEDNSEIAVSILAFAILATSVIGTAVVLNLQSQPAAAAEPCIGLGCWPPDPPVKHRPAQRATLPPVW